MREWIVLIGCRAIMQQPPSVLASLCPFNFFLGEPSVAFFLYILLPLLFIVHISAISLLLLTQPPFGPVLKMSLNADSLLYKSSGCDLEYI